METNSNHDVKPESCCCNGERVDAGRPRKPAQVATGLLDTYRAAARRGAVATLPASALGVQAQDDVLVVIAEAATEDVDAARMLGVVPDADAQADRVMGLDVEILERDR